MSKGDTFRADGPALCQRHVVKVSNGELMHGAPLERPHPLWVGLLAHMVSVRVMG